MYKMGGTKAAQDTSNMTANELKELGNKFYSQRKYSDAISLYAKAISKNPSIPTYFTNRALCHLKQKQWDLALQDCKRALELDSCMVKAHFFLGQALLELGSHDESIASLMRAHDLAKEQNKNFGDEITSILRIAKKRRWMLIEEKRIQEEIELQVYLNNLILGEKERQQKDAKEIADGAECEEELEIIDIEHQKRIREVNSIFQQIDDRRKKREVPDYLCGKISFELMRDPVITPSGITYDRKDIEEHLQRVGHFDPVTRAELRQEQLITNHSMKEVIDTFNEENPWGEEY